MSEGGWLVGGLINGQHRAGTRRVHQRGHTRARAGTAGTGQSIDLQENMTASVRLCPPVPRQNLHGKEGRRFESVKGSSKSCKIAFPSSRELIRALACSRYGAVLSSPLPIRRGNSDSPSHYLTRSIASNDPGITPNSANASIQGCAIAGRNRVANETRVIFLMTAWSIGTYLARITPLAA
jgi:hypothetical protein